MQSTTPISQETDASLLSMMGQRKLDRPLALEAWGEFYRRHIRYVYVFCRKAFTKVRDFESIVEETMERALQGAATFDTGGLTDRRALEVRTRRWLKQIARNVFLTTMESCEKVPVSYRDPVLIPEPKPQRDTVVPVQPSQQALDVRSAIASLDHKKREVIEVWLQFGDPKNPNAHLPDEVLKEVCSKLKITAAYFRQIKKRALAELETKLGHMRYEAKTDESETTAR